MQYQQRHRMMNQQPHPSMNQMNQNPMNYQGVSRQKLKGVQIHYLDQKKVLLVKSYWPFFYLIFGKKSSYFFSPFRVTISLQL